MNKDSLIYLLDTNVCIMYLKERSLSIYRRIHASNTNNIVLCSIVKGELFFGSRKSLSPQESLEKQAAFINQFISLPFNDECAEFYGSVRANLAKLGTPIGSNDIQIAAIALANELILVTHNVREFERVDGLKIEDWEEV